MRSLRSSNSTENCEFGYADADWPQSRNAADGLPILGSARSHWGATDINAIACRLTVKSKVKGRVTVRWALLSVSGGRTNQDGEAIIHAMGATGASGAIGKEARCSGPAL